jgi:biopolymer transport protein ExbD
MRHQREEEYLSGNLTAMIDVVFQLIIFFVCTVNIQDTAIDDRVSLAMAPHGKPVETKSPLEINVSVDGKGITYIARTPISQDVLIKVMRKAVADYGQQIPVVIRGDAEAKHVDIKRVMDACAQAGIWKIKFAAFKERGK